jgi:hypothetical protein
MIMKNFNNHFCIFCGVSLKDVSNPFQLLDGNLLCSGCYRLIKSGVWENILHYPGRVPDPYILNRIPKPPTLGERILSLFGHDNYKIRREEFLRKYDSYLREKKRTEEIYHNICNFWPKETPPDWRWRRSEVSKRAGNKCEECGEVSDTLNVHHIKSRGKGGTHEFSNLVVLCTKCHVKKKESGHKMILTPRSDDIAWEKEIVEKIRGTFGYWNKQKAKSIYTCVICRQAIEPRSIFFVRFELPDGYEKREKLYGEGSTRISIRKATKAVICYSCNRVIQMERYVVKTVKKRKWIIGFPKRFCLNCCLKKVQIVCEYCKKRYRFYY